MDMPVHTPMEELEVFKRYVEVADWAWFIVETWSPFSRGTVGKQLVRACDSIGANLVEGDGRRTDRGAVQFFVIARASAREARYWLQRAAKRNLISPTEGAEQIAILGSATQLLNRLIRYRRQSPEGNRVSDNFAAYEADENPFWCDIDLEFPEHQNPGMGVITWYGSSPRRRHVIRRRKARDARANPACCRTGESHSPGMSEDT